MLDVMPEPYLHLHDRCWAAQSITVTNGGRPALQ